MKKLLFASLVFLSIACSKKAEKSEQQQDETVKTETVAAKKYACPMLCEGEKTYAQAGKCPVCKMELQEIALAETDTTGHVH